MKLLRYTLISLVVLSYHCENHENFISSPKGFQYRFLRHDIQGKKVQASDVILISLRLKINDSLIYDSQTERSELIYTIEDTTASYFSQILTLMYEGDSLQAKITAEKLKGSNHSIPGLYEIPDEGTILAEIKLTKIFSDEELKSLTKKELRRKKATETILIQNYIDRSACKFEKDTSGVFICVLEAGKGRSVKKGDKFLAHYEGRLLDGRIFYSSFEKNKPYLFKFGEDPLIPAWEYALEGRKTGEKIRFIAPFETAYGKEGSGNTIPPYATLVFDVKILDIQ